ncbi:Hypothetical predicted protein [Olea europaea subsp. europaea]|uniref:Uncharacterized protein n=1 Tax=Olea europaea subsp. europaea TaxID=158383 RepID=A0A8S0STH3_OLEEU|nr:Hypothetical predicted protein [Olea europaea subsp. europaea]
MSWGQVYFSFPLLLQHAKYCFSREKRKAKLIYIYPSMLFPNLKTYLKQQKIDFLLLYLKEEKGPSTTSFSLTQKMTSNYKLIQEINPNQKNWQATVIVAVKLASKQAKHSNSRYQNMVLMDLELNSFK